MKKSYLFLVILLTVSCSSFGNKEEINKATDIAIKRIENVEAETVSNAQKRIEEEITNKLGQANESIEVAIESAKITIQKNVEEIISSKLQKIENDIRRARLFGFIGIGLGLIGIVCSIYCIKVKITKDYVRAKISYHIYEDTDFETRIKAIINSSTNRTLNNQGLSKKDVENILKQSLLGDKEIQVFLSRFINKTVELSAKPSITEDEKTNPSSTPIKSVYELFAQDSRTMQLADTRPTFERGMSVYKLILNNPESNTADVTLCIDQEDVKHRILINDSQFLLPICEVKKSTTNPSEVIVKEKGFAEKNANGWYITKKVLVEIK